MTLNATTPSTTSSRPRLNNIKGYATASVESMEYLDKLRVLRSKKISLKGSDIIPFCKSVTEPGSESLADAVKVLALDLGDLCPSYEALRLVGQALKVLPNLGELTFLGFPERAIDNHGVFDLVPFSLYRFRSDLSLSSPTMVRFFASQKELMELQTSHSTPSPIKPCQGQEEYKAFPNEVVPYVTSLACAGPFLISLQLSTFIPPPLSSLRVDLNRLSRGEEADSLNALSMFSATIKSLSLQRKMVKNRWVSMSDVIESIASKRRWNLRYLDMQDGSYDPTSISALKRVIAKHFPDLETLVWAPSQRILDFEDPDSGEPLTANHIADTFFTFCPSLCYFAFCESPADEKNQGKYVWYSRYNENIYREGMAESNEVDNCWRQFVTGPGL